ncbi:GTP cyclohydrolase II RibA [Arthrobacter bambusae]|uniref:GTP cyclohydrolase II n=1 Tax=Arthrobacter bambusae TaxID=1338426 RepID=A0AAW8DA17_9MICC|nr:GTP cyclohydrolase II RibA [Arthrobacter bambusae]MDP9904580.1 GTP cyclohydrolase II [Arthrobacter bambusae]MDQ0129396.1 GTP cyclohydrolase II [Arthrobacter bambusae]MDQ0180991.1 GTP cyclohydrolase II [Arthrobacter bambusae]
MTASDETVREVRPLPTATVRSQVTVPLRFPDGFSATAEVLTFHGLADGKEHLLLGLGAWEQALPGRLPEDVVYDIGAAVDRGTGEGAPLVRLHSECMTGNVFGSERCDCGPQLREAVEKIAAAGGFLLYLRQEGRGIGLYSKLDAYALQGTGLDTYEANLALGYGEDERDYTAAAQMLKALGTETIRLLSNNPDKAAQLSAHGIEIAEQVPTGVHLSATNHRYLEAKRGRTAHTLELPTAAVEPLLKTLTTKTPSLKAPSLTTPSANLVAVLGPAGLLDRVDQLIPRLRERAEETEQLRRLPDSTIEELKDAGLFRLLAPRQVGGYGMGVETYAEVIRRLARGCASTAWTAGHLIEHVWMLARWPRRVQDEVFSTGSMPLAAATGAPVGTARKVPGGFSIAGRWSFASGVMHSEWALLAVQCEDVRLQCLVPVAELELLDAWHTAGLRGTGSNDLRAENLFVPEYRVLDWAALVSADNPGSAIHQDSLIHTHMGALLNIVAPSAALGAAESAVDLFREQMLVRKVKNTVESRQADYPLAQARYAQAYGLLVTARLHWHEAIRLVSASQERQELSEVERAKYRLSFALSAMAAEEAVRLITTGSGGSAQRLSHPLQRIQRDINVLLNHPTLSTDPILEQAGRGLLGLGFTVPAF